MGYPFSLLTHYSSALVVGSISNCGSSRGGGTERGFYPCSPQFQRKEGCLLSAEVPGKASNCCVLVPSKLQVQENL